MSVSPLIKRIPPFPTVGSRLIHVLDGEAAGIGEIVSMIQSDVAISAEIIRLANSASAASRFRVTTVRQGVMALGINRIRRIAMAASVSAYVTPIARNRPLLNAWKHSVATAHLAAMLSAASSQEPERAYTAALLADIGLIGLMLLYPAQYSILLSSAAGITCLLETERTISGIDHCEAGRQLSECWSFPEDMQRVARGHHEPPDPAESGLTAVIHWSGRLAAALGYPIGRIVEDMDVVESDLPTQLRSPLPQDLQTLSIAIDQAVGDAISSLGPC